MSGSTSKHNIINGLIRSLSTRSIKESPEKGEQGGGFWGAAPAHREGATPRRPCCPLAAAGYSWCADLDVVRMMDIRQDGEGGTLCQSSNASGHRPGHPDQSPRRPFFAIRQIQELLLSKTPHVFEFQREKVDPGAFLRRIHLAAPLQRLPVRI